MDEGDGDKFIVPALFDDEVGTHHYCNLAVVRPTNENESTSDVDNDEKVSTTSVLILRVNSDDSFPTHFGSLDLKCNSSIMENSDYGFYGHAINEGENRDQVYGTSSSCTPTTFRDDSPHKIKKNIVMSCFMLLTVVTVTLAWKLNQYTLLTSRLQTELNQASTLLEDCRVPRDWLIDSRELKVNTNSFQIETCWLDARVTVGPCVESPFESARDAIKSRFQDMAFYYNKYRYWWAITPSEPYPIHPGHDLPEHTWWNQQEEKEASAQINTLSKPSDNTHQCYFWSLIKSWFSGESKLPSNIKNPSLDEEESCNQGSISFISLLQNSTIFHRMHFK